MGARAMGARARARPQGPPRRRPSPSGAPDWFFREVVVAPALTSSSTLTPSTTLTPASALAPSATLTPCTPSNPPHLQILPTFVPSIVVVVIVVVVVVVAVAVAGVVVIVVVVVTTTAPLWASIIAAPPACPKVVASAPHRPIAPASLLRRPLARILARLPAACLQLVSILFPHSLKLVSSFSRFSAAHLSLVPRFSPTALPPSLPHIVATTAALLCRFRPSPILTGLGLEAARIGADDCPSGPNCSILGHIVSKLVGLC